MFIIGTESCWASWEIWHLNVDDLLFGKVINTEWYSSVICHILGTFIIKRMMMKCTAWLGFCLENFLSLFQRNFEIISCLSSLRKLKWWFVDIFSFLFMLNSTGRLRVDNRQHMLYQVCYLNITLFFLSLSLNVFELLLHLIYTHILGILCSFHSNFRNFRFSVFIQDLYFILDHYQWKVWVILHQNIIWYVYWNISLFKSTP